MEEFEIGNSINAGAPGSLVQQGRISPQVQQFAEERGLTGLREFNRIGTGTSQLSVLGTKEGQFLIVLQTPIKTFCSVVHDVYAAGQAAMTLSFLTDRVSKIGASR